MSIAVVDESGSFVAGLNKSDLRATSKSGEISITAVDLKTDCSLDILFLHDVSLSQERLLPIQKEIVKRIIDSIVKKNVDRVAVGTLSDKVGLLQDLTFDVAIAKKSLDSIKVDIPPGYVGGGVATGSGPLPTSSLQGSTSLWTGIYSAVNGFGNITSSERRKVIVLLTDGVDTSSVSKLNDAVNAAISSNVFVLAIGVGDELYNGIDKDSMRKFADRSGGHVMFPKNLSDLSELLPKTVQVLRSYYEIVLPVTSSVKGNKLIEVKIEIKKPKDKESKLRIFAPRAMRLQ